MNTRGDFAESKEKSKLPTAAFWLGAILALYLFGSGPITRWFPATADKMYAPLSPLAHSQVFGKALLHWLSLWGVDAGSPARQVSRAPAGGAVLVNTDAGVLAITNNASARTVVGITR